MTLRATSAHWMCTSIDCANASRTTNIRSRFVRFSRARLSPGGRRVNRNSGGIQSRRRALIGTAAIVGIFVVLVAAFSLAYFVTAWMYAQIGQAPAPWLAQIINSVLGLFVIALIMAALSFTFGAKQRSLQMRVFNTHRGCLGQNRAGGFFHTLGRQ